MESSGLRCTIPTVWMIVFTNRSSAFTCEGMQRERGGRSNWNVREKAGEDSVGPPVRLHENHSAYTFGGTVWRGRPLPALNRLVRHGELLANEVALNLGRDRFAGEIPAFLLRRLPIANGLLPWSRCVETACQTKASAALSRHEGGRPLSTSACDRPLSFRMRHQQKGCVSRGA